MPYKVRLVRMALIVMCSRCGFVLKRVEAEGSPLTVRVPMLTEVSRHYGSQCPRCLKLLSLKPEAIMIQPVGSQLPRPSRVKVGEVDWPLKPRKGTRILPLMRLS
jgi:hypothetical protein